MHFVRAALEFFNTLSYGDGAEEARAIAFKEPYDLKATRYKAGRLIAGTSATTLNAAPLISDATFFGVFVNRDPDNFVTFTYRCTGGAGTTQTRKLYPGALCIIPDITIAAVNMIFTADTAACNVDFFISEERSGEA